MSRGLKCETALQGAIDLPIKMKDTMFQSNLEIVGCNENKLNGMYHMTFHLKDGILLKSWNKKHEDIIIKNNKELFVLGVAKHIIKSL